MFSLPLVFALSVPCWSADLPDNARRPRDDAELRIWLENMVWHHQFSNEEIIAATGLTTKEIQSAQDRFKIHPDTKPQRPAGSKLLVMPYPGGRHPRIGFRDGAVRPQRETKVSVFTPWDESSYVVVDVPEAIWSNLGLTYLAHTHVPTVWTKQKIEMERLEWKRRKDGSFDVARKLPNGIAFATKVVPAVDHVAMEMTLTNGTKEILTDLRVQVCVLLKGAKGFEQQDNKNKVFAGAYVACKSSVANRWVITAWQPLHRAWANPPCPCLHSDPKFADCPPGETQRVHGRLWFYTGADVQAEIRRLDQTDWRKDKATTPPLSAGTPAERGGG